MRRILGDEDTTRETGPAGSHEVAPGREGILAQRSVRADTGTSHLATKGARARAEHAQRDYEGD